MMNDLKTINNLQRLNLSTFALHQNTFPRFKGIHRGETVVIFATGPSAEKYEPNKLHYHIGVNRAFEIANRKGIGLDYIFIQDYSGATPEYIDELDNYKTEHPCTKFYGLTLEFDQTKNRVIPESHAIKANALRYRTDYVPIECYEPQFAYDLSTQPLGCFGSVVMPALQFALWTYPKEILLVGCDCNTNGYAFSDKPNELYPNLLKPAYIKFKKFASKYYPDIKITSINPVGLKGVFEDVYTGKEL